MSSAHFNGADLGVRQSWLPLFDKYGVDLVVAGHEHHFERTFPVRGVLSGSDLLTPAPQGTDPSVMDTSSVGPGSPQSQHPTVTTTEPAPWSAYRDLQTPYGFASFDFVPHEAGGTTSITVTHYGADKGSAVYSPRDQFVMRKALTRFDAQTEATAATARR